MTAETFSQFSPRLSACTSSILANPRTCALFLDVDGTLLDLADTPKGVRVPDGLIGTLQRLLAASGVHGAELRKGPDRDIERVTATLPSDLVQSMRRLAIDIPGVIAEPKGAGIAVHYRLAPQAEGRVLETLEAALGKHAGAFELLPGKRLFEVIPSGLSKGTALASLSSLPAFQGRVPVMIGDDVGDEPAFAAAEGMHGFGLRVAGEQYPMEGADFAGPRSVINWLDQLSRRVAASERPQARV